MHAQKIEAFGEPGLLRLVNLPGPQRGPGDGVVTNAVTSMNPVGHRVRRQGHPVAPNLPASLGCALAGTLLAVVAEAGRAHLRRPACRGSGAGVARIPSIDRIIHC